MEQFLYFINYLLTMISFSFFLFLFTVLRKFTMKQLCQLTSLTVDIFATWYLCQLTTLPLDIFASWQLCQLTTLPVDNFASWHLCHLISLPVDNFASWHLCQLTSLPVEIFSSWYLCQLTSLPVDIFASWQLCYDTTLNTKIYLFPPVIDYKPKFFSLRSIIHFILGTVFNRDFLIIIKQTFRKFPFKKVTDIRSL